MKTYYSLRCAQPAGSALRRALEPLFVVVCAVTFSGVIWLARHQAVRPDSGSQAVAIAAGR